MATVRLDTTLRELVPQPELAVPSASVGTLIAALEAQYPALHRRLRDASGAIRPSFHVFVNGEDVRGLQGLNTPLAARDQVEILGSVQGG